MPEDAEGVKSKILFPSLFKKYGPLHLLLVRLVTQRISQDSMYELCDFAAIEWLPWLQESGTVFDRRVVSALLNHLENHGGAIKWAHFLRRN